MSTFKDLYIETKQDVIDAVETYGFLPFFGNEIPGFSIEEHISRKAFFSDEPGIWEWKGAIIQESRCAYGKFFRNKAAFISRKWFYDFANYRRDGYDYEARCEDGLATYPEQYLYELISSHRSMLSKDAKAIGGYVKPRTSGPDQWEPRKGFDTTITRLQMQTYIITSDFEYELDKKGNFYGWGIARYTTPEVFFGKSFAPHVYKRTPEESQKRILRQLKKILPDADPEDLRRFLG